MKIFMSLGYFFFAMSGFCMLYGIGFVSVGVFIIEKKAYKDSLSGVTGWTRAVHIVMSTIKYRHDLLFFYSVIFGFISYLMLFLEDKL